MHDALFTHQDDLEVPALIAYARDIGLDVPRFVRDLQTHRHLATVRRDFLDGVRSGVNATPTMIVNGKYRVTGRSFEDILRITNQLIAQERAAAGR
jgi:predicted DsbA family dithiol-disulfide isomerase